MQYLYVGLDTSSSNVEQNATNSSSDDASVADETLDNATIE